MRLGASGSKGESVALRYGPWGWFWIGISLLLVAAVAALWVFLPPKCRGSVLCVGGPPKTERSERVPSERRVPSGQDDRASERVPSGKPEPQVGLLSGPSVPVVASAPEPAEDPVNRPDRPDRPADKVYGWERHGKPTPPGHGGSPPGQGGEPRSGR